MLLLLPSPLMRALAAAGWPLPLAMGVLIGCALAWQGFDFWPIGSGLVAVTFVGFRLLRHYKIEWQQGRRVVLFLITGLVLAWPYAHWRIAQLQPPTLPAQLSEYRNWYVGQVFDVEIQPKRNRLILVNVKPYGDARGLPIERMRISTSRGRLKNIQPGDWVAAQVKLMADNTPQFPGDFDSRAYKLRENLDATGMLWGKIRPAWEADELAPPTWRMKLNKLRHQISDQLMTDGKNTQAAALASALLVGVRDGLTDETREDFRGSGLAHLLAISGLHVGLIGGLIFFWLRFGLACWPYAALHWNIKTIAGIVGMLTALGYMMLAGLTIPTIRAALMLSSIFIAFMLGRVRQGLRLLSLVAAGMLLVWPPLVISPSFQLSFAATLALLLWAARDYQPKSRIGLVQISDYLYAVWATSVVAGLATLPLAAWHFQQISLAGLLVNLPAVPLTGLFVLPLGLIHLISTVLGFGELTWWLARAPLDWLLWMAHYGADLPFGDMHAPSWSIWLVTALTLVALLAYILRRWGIFWVGLVSLGAFTLAIPLIPQPHRLFELNEGQTVVQQTGNTEAVLLKSNGEWNEKYLLRGLEQRYGLTIRKSDDITK